MNLNVRDINADSRNREPPFRKSGVRAAALDARGLACVRGGRRLFADIDFTLGASELLHVQGANGAGKTSLLRQVAGLCPPDVGEVRWRGTPIGQQRETLARDLLYLGHLSALKDELSPLENLRADAALAGLADDEAALRQALTGWGLARQMRLPARLLSAGQRRRAALARLELSAARLWILDEPLVALDDRATQRLRECLGRHLQRRGMVVLTTHQPLSLPARTVKTLRLGA